MSKTTEDANLSEEDLRAIVREGGARMDRMLGNMQAYNANINGSNAYLHQWRNKLEALMEQEGMSSIWFSVSMADNHWQDLARALDPPGDEPRVFESEADAAKFRRKMVRDSPHLVDAFFMHRVKAMLKTFFGKDGFEAAWHFVRLELQKRGVFHAHGCLRLKSDPGFNRLALEVYAGRQAQRAAGHAGIILEDHEKFTEEQTANDEWVDLEDPDDNADEMEMEWSESTIAETKETIRKGMEAEKTITAFQTLMLSTMHPDPPSDAGSDNRDEGTFFVPGENIKHPSGQDGRLATEETRGPLLNACARHVHQAYCQESARTKKASQQQSAEQQQGQPPAPPPAPPPCTNKDCRFDIPYDLCNKCHVVVVEQEVKGKDGEKKKKILLHVRPKRTIDLGRVVAYMTKYVTKSEASMTRGAQRMITRIMRQTLDAGGSVQHALKKTMSKLLGERLIPKQECCHLIMGRQTCFCSHSFINVNLKNDVHKVLQPDAVADENEQNNGAVDVDAAAAAAASKKVVQKSLVDAYATRRDASTWATPELHNAHSGELDALSLNKFCKFHCVGMQGQHKNKIKKRPSDKVVIVFKPKLSSNPGSASYTDYCKYALTKYKPWVVSPDTLWGGADATDERIRVAWDEYLQSFLGSDLPVPDFIRRELEANRGRRDAGGPGLDTRQNDDDPDADLEDWADNDGDFRDTDVNLDDDGIRVAHDHDWSVTAHEYDFIDFEIVSQEYQQMVDSFVADVEPARDIAFELNEMQQLGKELIVELVRRKPNDGKLGIMVGKGGTGKSTTIQAAEHTLESIHGVGCVVKLATTGKAASVIGGSTLHSPKTGLGVPVGTDAFTELNGAALRRLQDRLRGVRLILIDEYSMLRQKELSYIDKILRQVGDADEPFGGFAILLVGDPAQIPAVKGRVMWDRSTGGTAHDNFGHLQYHTFNEVIELTEVRRLEDADGALAFLDLLNHIRDGDCTEDDWKHTKVSCSKETMPAAEWKERFEETTDNVTYIFNTNNEVNAHNIKRLISLDEPIALIQAEHTGESRSMSDDIFRGLRSFLYLAVFARVVMTSNVCQPAGLVNVSVSPVR
jgi:hypothetical protein